MKKETTILGNKNKTTFIGGGSRFRGQTDRDESSFCGKRETD